MHRFRLLTLVASLAGAQAFVGCAQDSTEGEDASSIASALEMENGGLEETDEAPAFGDADLETPPDESLASVPDPMADDGELGAMRDRPDGRAFRVLAMWGQARPNPEITEWTDWSGAFHVGQGAILVNREMRFEPRDLVLPRTSPNEVRFVSRTLPHNDGLLMTVFVPPPDPAAPAPNALVLASRALPRPLPVPVPALEHLRLELPVGDAGNRLVLLSRPAPPPGCAAGFLHGRWEEAADGRGRFGGRVVNDEGELVGHIRGIYGVRRDGSPVAFGKYIDREGHVRGLLRGRYGDGRFEGQWIVRGGDHGVMAGRYGEDGRFGGMYHELGCLPERPPVEGEGELEAPPSAPPGDAPPPDAPPAEELPID